MCLVSEVYDSHNDNAIEKQIINESESSLRMRKIFLAIPDTRQKWAVTRVGRKSMSVSEGCNMIGQALLYSEIIMIAEFASYKISRYQPSYGHDQRR